MRSFSTALVVLWLGVGALLVMGAPNKQDDEFSDDQFDDGHGHEHNHQAGGHRPRHQQQHGHHQVNHKPGHDLDKPDAGLLGKVTDGLTGLVAGNKGSPLLPFNGALLGGGETPLAKAAQVATAPITLLNKPDQVKGSGNEVKDAVLEPVKSVTELAKLALNPLELIKHISSNFKLPFGGLVEKIGDGLVFGLEALLQPLVTCVRIVEKIFQPDTCRLKFICKLSSHLHFAYKHLPKFSNNFLESTAHMKALTDGLSGKDCEHVYKECNGSGLRLKKPFEELKGLKEGGGLGKLIPGARALDSVGQPQGVEQPSAPMEVDTLANNSGPSMASASASASVAEGSASAAAAAAVAESSAAEQVAALGQKA